jgi:hypothetical protein
MHAKQKMVMIAWLLVKGQWALNYLVERNSNVLFLKTPTARFK